MALRPRLAITLITAITPLWCSVPPVARVTTLAGTQLDSPPAIPPYVPATISSLPLLPQQLSVPLVDSQVLAFLHANPQLLNVAVTPDLRVDYIHLVRGVSRLSDRVYVHLLQTDHGIDVADTDISFSVDPSANPLRIDSLHSRLYPVIVVASPRLPANQEARQRLAIRAGTPNARLLPARIRWIDGQWQALQEFSLADEGLHAGVNAAGKVYVWDDRQYSSYSGNVSGRGVAFDPLATGDALNVMVMPYLTIADGLGTESSTDSAGNYTFMTPSTTNLAIGLSGLYGVVQDVNNTPLQATLTAGAPNPVNLLFNPSGNTETNTAQVNGYVHEQIVHDYIKSKGVAPAGIDTALTVFVNEGSACNSYYAGDTINFFKSGGGCLNSAYDTFIYHEYGHFIDALIGGITDGGLSEGWGDIMAMFVSGQSLMGEGFYGIPGSGVRNGVNNYIYNSGDEVHIEGQAWMGFAWDLRTSLIAALGSQQGIALAENLVLPVFWANSPDIPSAVREVGLRDSPDSDPTHGPHFSEILAAANHHGLAGAFTLAIPVITILSPAPNATVAGIVTLSGTVTDFQRVVSVAISAGGNKLGVANGTNSWTYALDTTLLANGPISLSVTAVDYGLAQATVTLALIVSNTGQASYNSALKAPACSDMGPVCDSMGLLNSRGNLAGGGELNQPNTIYNSCPDGNDGTFHVDESSDRLKILTLDGQPFAPGKTVQIESTVWAYSPVDSLDLYYTANATSPAWTFIATLRPAATGLQVLSATYTLPNGSLQAVRANFRYGGQAAPCTTGGYDDHDDLAFAVVFNSPPPPSVPLGVTFSNATFNSLNLSWNASTPVPAVGYRIDIATDPAFTNYVSGYQNLDVGGALSRLVTGLNASTSYYARVRAYDASANVSPNSATVTGITSPLPVPVITSPATAVATVGSNFTYNITATNNPTSFNATGLPVGLSVNTATGLISGVPLYAGTSGVTLTATNAGGPGIGSLLLTVNLLNPVITSAASATGTIGQTFTYTIAATNSPTSFSAASLPTGLSVNTTTGVISGVPAVSGTYTVSLGAANSAGSGTGTLILTIAAAGPPQAPVAAFIASALSGPAPFTVTFDGSSSTGGNLTYGWNFDDHSADWGQTVSHSYTTPGLYGVTLTVSNNLGTDHVRQILTVTGSQGN